MAEPLVIPDFSALKAGRWLLAISGGGDSMALALMLKNAEITTAWAHFNHHWGPWGNEAEAFVVAQAKRLNTKLYVGHGAGKPASNAEAHARTARYAFFGQLCSQHGYTGVLVAHTQTDVAENFLLRAGKGSGLAGLAGLRAESTLQGLKIIRPLLAYPREALRTYLTEQQQPWLEDPSNQNASNQRSKIRALLPALTQAGITAHGLAAASASLQRAHDAFQQLTEDFLRQYPNAIPLTALATQPPELQLMVVGRLIETLTTSQAPRTSKRLALLTKITTSPQGKATLGGVLWVWQHGTLAWAIAPKVKPRVVFHF